MLFSLFLHVENDLPSIVYSCLLGTKQIYLISAFDFLKNVPSSVILLFLIFILLWAIESSCLLLYYEYRTTTYKRYNKHNGIEIFLVLT